MQTDARLGLWLAMLLGVGGVLYLLAPVLTPFLFAALLAYLGDPVADRLEKLGMSRTLAVSTVFLVIFGTLIVLVVVLVPTLERQVRGLILRLPAYIDWVQAHVLPWLQANLGLDPSVFEIERLREELRQHLGKAGGIVASLLGSVTRSTAVVASWLANLLLIPVVTFYLLRDWDVLVVKVHDLLPRRIEPVISRLTAESDEVLSAFLRGQFMVMLALGSIYAAGLTLVGLDFSLLIGMLAGLLSFIPYLGTIVGLGIAGVAAVLQFQDLLHLLGVMVVFGTGQALEGMVLTPRLVGEQIGLHPVAVIFAVLAGGNLFGFFGVLLALPVAAVVMVLLRHTHDEYLRSGLYEKRPSLDERES